MINYNYKDNWKAIVDPQRGKWKRDPRPMQGSALLLLTITFSITELLKLEMYV